MQFSFPYICSPSFQTATCCSAIRCIAYPLGSVFCLIFFFLMWHLYWVATRICASSCWLSQTIIIISASFCGWHSITRSHGWNCYDMRTIPILFSSSTASSLLTHWGRGHLNCLNARSRGLNNLNQLLYCVSLNIYNKFANNFCELKFSGNTHQRP